MKFSFELYRTKKRRELLNSNDRLHFAVKAKITADLRMRAKYDARNYLAIIGMLEDPFIYSKHNPCGVTVTVFSPTRRRLDPPNLYPTVKALLDGFTDAGIWTDDNSEVIKSLTFLYGGLSGNKAYRLEIEIEGHTNGKHSR